MTAAETVLAEHGPQATHPLFERAAALGGLCTGGYIFFDDSTLKIVWDGASWQAVRAC